MLTKKQKKELIDFIKYLFFRWILPLYIAWQCGYNMCDMPGEAKFYHEAYLVTRYVKMIDDIHEKDSELISFIERKYIKKSNENLELRKKINKLEHKDEQRVRNHTCNLLN